MNLRSILGHTPTTFAGKLGEFTVLFGTLTALAGYIAACTISRDPNPFNWSEIVSNRVAQIEMHQGLLTEASMYADRNGNGKLEPSELEELYQRAGLGVPALYIQNIYEDPSVSPPVSSRLTSPILTTPDLEAAVASYRTQAGN